MSNLNATRIILVRHGQARANVDRVIAGLVGCRGLTELGEVQARTLTARWTRLGFRPDALVSSPVRRARETAGILAQGFSGLSVREDCGLCEMHNGEADGLTFSEYETHYGRFDLMAEPMRPVAPGAECWHDVLVRVQSRMEAIAGEYAGKTVVVVTHAGFVVATMITLLAIGNAPQRAYLDPQYTSLTRWLLADGRWELESFNDTSHLEAETILVCPTTTPAWTPLFARLEDW